MTLRKGVMYYEYINSWGKKINKKLLPAKQKFFTELTIKNIRPRL